MDRSEQSREGDFDDSAQAAGQSRFVEQGASPPLHSRWGILPIVLVLLLITITCMVAYLTDRRLDALESSLGRASPMVIVDLARLASTYPQGASTEELERLMVEANDKLTRLGEAGYIVLDSSAVLRAPSNLFLGPGSLLPATGPVVSETQP